MPGVGGAGWSGRAVGWSSSGSGAWGAGWSFGGSGVGWAMGSMLTLSGESSWDWVVERKLFSIIWGSLCLHFFIISDLLFSMRMGSPLAMVAFSVRQRLQSWPPLV